MAKSLLDIFCPLCFTLRAIRNTHVLKMHWMYTYSEIMLYSTGASVSLSYSLEGIPENTPLEKGLEWKENLLEYMGQEATKRGDILNKYAFLFYYMSLMLYLAYKCAPHTPALSANRVVSTVSGGWDPGGPW